MSCARISFQVQTGLHIHSFATFVAITVPQSTTRTAEMILLLQWETRIFSLIIEVFFQTFGVLFWQQLRNCEKQVNV
jgi:hypothetical protein